MDLRDSQKDYAVHAHLSLQSLDFALRIGPDLITKFHKKAYQSIHEGRFEKFNAPQAAHLLVFSGVVLIDCPPRSGSPAIENDTLFGMKT